MRTPDSDAHKRSLRDRLGERPWFRWLVLGVLLFGLFAVGLNFTVLTVVLPSLAKEFGTDLATVQFVVSAPILVFGLCSPLLGKVADRFGARVTYLVGFGTATVLFALTGFAWSFGSLLVIRLIAALEGAATGPATIKIIATLFPPEERSKALGWWSMVSAGGPAIGLVVGAVVIPTFGWRVMFFAQAVLCLAVLAVALFLVPDTPHSDEVRLDLPGVALLGGVFLFLMAAIEFGRALGWTSPVVLAAFALSPVCVAAFIWWERRTPTPGFPLRYFARRNFSLSLAASTLTNFAYLGGFILAVPMLESVLKMPQGTATLVVFTRPAVFTLVAPISGYVIVRLGERTMGALGAFLIAAASATLGAVTVGSGFALPIIGLALAGAGLGACQPAFNNALVNSVELRDQGVAGGMSGAMQSIGSSIGTVVLTAVQASVLASGASLAASFQVAYRLAAAVALVAAVLALCLRRGSSAHQPTLAEELAADPAAIGEPEPYGA